MKTVCKKLMSLMLVAMLLVSAIPFLASADGDVEVDPVAEDTTSVQPDAQIEDQPETQAAVVTAITVVVKVDGAEAARFEKEPSNGKSAKMGNLLTYGWNKAWTDSYTFDHAWNSTKQKDVAMDDEVAAGDLVYVALKTKAAAPTTPPATTPSTTPAEPTAPSTPVNKFPYDAYLHIYVNNKVDVPAKTVKITDGIAVDGLVNKAEVENVVRNYYNAQNSKGIMYDGLYLARGNWVSNFAQDLAKYDQITDIIEARKTAEVHINVMITNAVAKNSSNTNSGNADPSNPKTGDSIVTTVVALGLSASALAALCYISNKKRHI